MVIPARQRLLPMPTFGRQPVSVVAGQVVSMPEDADVEVVQGRIAGEPGVQGNSSFSKRKAHDRANDISRIFMSGKQVQK